MNRFLILILLGLGGLAACTDAHTEYTRHTAEYAARLEANPEDVDAHYWMGVTYLSAGKWKAGANHLKDAVRLDKNHTRALRDLGWALYRLGDLAAAEQRLRESLSLHGDDPKTIANLGTVLMARNKHSEAAMVLSRAVRNGLTTFEIHNNLAIAYKHLGEMPKAVEQLQKASRLAPESAEVQNNLGAVYESLNMDGDAFKKYTLALQLDPDLARAHYNLGAWYARAGNKLMALGHMHSARRLAPRDPVVRIGLGRAYAALKKYDKALEQYEASMQYRPADAATHFAMAELYHLNQQIEKALESYELAVSLDPDRVHAYHHLGILYDKLGNGEKAVLYTAVAQELFRRRGMTEDADASRHNLRVFSRKYHYTSRALQRLLKRHEIGMSLG